MNKQDFAFRNLNYIICGVAILVIVIGFILMTGSSTTMEDGFQPDIFSTRRIIVGPMTSFFGFLLMIVGILYKLPEKKELTSKDDK